MYVIICNESKSCSSFIGPSFFELVSQRGTELWRGPDRSWTCSQCPCLQPRWRQGPWERKPNVFSLCLQCLTWGKIRRHYSSRCRDKEISEASHVSTEQVAICQFPLRKMNIKICHFHQYYDLSFSIWHESWSSVIKLLFGYNCCCLCHSFVALFCHSHCLYIFLSCYLCRFIYCCLCRCLCGCLCCCHSSLKSRVMLYIQLCVHWWLFFRCQNYILSNLKRMIFSFGKHTNPRISITFYFDLFDVGVYSWSTSQWPSVHFYQNALKLCKNNSYSNFLVI